MPYILFFFFFFFEAHVFNISPFLFRFSFLDRMTSFRRKYVFRGGHLDKIQRSTYFFNFLHILILIRIPLKKFFFEIWKIFFILFQNLQPQMIYIYVLVENLQKWFTLILECDVETLTLNVLITISCRFLH